MNPPVFTALGVVSAAGVGVDALAAAVASGRGCFGEAPYPLPGVERRRCAAVEGLDREAPTTALLELALADAALPALPPGTGLVLATASGGRAVAWERWHRAALAGDDAGPGPREGRRQAPTEWLAAKLGLKGPAVTVSVACASGTAALDVAAGWLREGRVPAVVVAAVDALCPFVHAGFAGLGALAERDPRPFHPDRDGLLLGEGAAVLLLEPSPARRPLATLLGVGLSGDAWRAAAPHPEGAGLARAGRAALDEAGLDEAGQGEAGHGPAGPTPGLIAALSSHGTGTVRGDAAEARAIAALFGDAPPTRRDVKAAIGHCLGASGALEIALEIALKVAPADAASAGPALSWSAAFGGVNAAAVIGPPASAAPPRPPNRAVRQAASAQVSATRGSPDAYHAAVHAVTDALLESTGVALSPATGLVLTSRRGCALADRRFHARLLREGPARVSRRDFVQTVPGAPLGEVAVARGLTGPQLVLLAAPEEGAAVARRWVAEGRCPAAVAVDCEPGIRTDSGADSAAEASATLYLAGV